MRKLMIAAALVSTALATPALARDGSIYVGLDAGLLRPDSLKLDFDNGSTSVRDGLRLRHKWGFDVDGVGGYDFGMFRLEGEIGYKHAKIKDAPADLAVIRAVRPFNFGGDSFDSSGHTSVYSAMLNALVDLGPQDGFNASLGGGIGLAKTRVTADLTPSTALNFRSEDRSMAWQLLAEVRVPISPNIDVGIKGRHFETSRLHFGPFCETTCPSITPFDLKGRFKSNSVLASVIYNFYTPPPPPPPAPPPPPPPPPPPATQTCPDGSVIPATATCPAPPPPPPPPPPAPERGE